MDLVNAELGRLLRRWPGLRSYRDDLAQDGEVARLLSAGAHPAAARIRIRGYLLRCGFKYLHISERSRLEPKFCELQEWDAAAEPPGDAALVVQGLAKVAAPRTQRAMLAVLEGATVREAARAVGVSHESVYTDFRALRKAA